jgi:cold shock CspA family protein
MSTNTAEQHTTTGTEQSQGRVKWFNNKAGYGFITVSDGPVDGDVFVHHSALSVTEEQYKYLVQGEYVEFQLTRVEGGQHEWQATSVRGCNGGKLMCETRREVRSSRVSRTSTTPQSSRSEVEVSSRPRTNAHASRHLQSDVREPTRLPVRFVGQGPRGDDGSEWMLVRRTSHASQTHQQTQNSQPHKTTRRPRLQQHYRSQTTETD